MQMLTPTDLKIDKLTDEKDHGRYSFEPLPSGYGHTLGNTLRRVLLSSLPGAAPTQVKIEGVAHPFSSLEGVKEDMVELTLNIKQLRVKLRSDDPAVLTLKASGKGKVKAGDISCPSEAEVVNPKLILANLTSSQAKLNLEIIVERGRGYEPAKETSKVGIVCLDSVFSPVVHAAYTVETIRAGQLIGLDKLTMEIKTDGTMAPYDALMEAGRILGGFFTRIGGGEKSLKEEKKVPAVDQRHLLALEAAKEILVEELHIPTRTINALRKGGVKTLADLAGLEEEELLKVRNLGEKSLKEIDKLLRKEKLRE